MTGKQWQRLLNVVNGTCKDPVATGFIIDCPWLPGWCGISTLDYFTSDEKWLAANLKATETFCDVLFLPGFWAEYGMCTEPSAFGAKAVWVRDNMPHAEKIIHTADQIDALRPPNPETDGLLPFVLQRLKNGRPQINAAGHEIRFAVSRGPLNIATFLMGTTEFLMLLKTDAPRAHRLLDVITEFSIDWLSTQKQAFPAIDGILLLDDILGFIGREDFETFALPRLQKIFSAFGASVRFLHNDADGLVTARYLGDIGVNLFNFSFQHSLDEIQTLAGDGVALLGNIPPRDVLAEGTPQDIQAAVRDVLQRKNAATRLILSCGGGMPPGVSTENIHTFLHAAAATSH